MINLVEKDGWFIARFKESHGHFTLKKKGTVTVAGKPAVDLNPKTLNSILKQAGFKK